MAPPRNLLAVAAAALMWNSTPASGSRGLDTGTETEKQPEKPNIVFFLTDDQDQVLGASFPPTAPNGVTPMPNVKVTEPSTTFPVLMRWFPYKSRKTLEM